MSKQGLGVFDILPLLNQQAGIVMPQAVESDGFQVGTFQALNEIPVDHVVMVDRLPCFVRGNKVQISILNLRSCARTCVIT